MDKVYDIGQRIDLVGEFGRKQGQIEELGHLCRFTAVDGVEHHYLLQVLGILVNRIHNGSAKLTHM